MQFKVIFDTTNAAFFETDVLSGYGGVAEWFKAAVLKTVVRKYRGFESYLLRHLKSFELEREKLNSKIAER